MATYTITRRGGNIILIYDDTSEYFQISMYADNVTEMMTELGEILKTELSISLANSTDWKSKILF